MTSGKDFLQQFLRVIGKGRQDVLTPPGWPLWRTTYHSTTSVWKMPLSWHWTDHSGGYWQHWNGACTQIVSGNMHVKILVYSFNHFVAVSNHCAMQLLTITIRGTESIIKGRVGLPPTQPTVSKHWAYTMSATNHHHDGHKPWRPQTDRQCSQYSYH